MLVVVYYYYYYYYYYYFYDYYDYYFIFFKDESTTSFANGRVFHSFPLDIILIVLNLIDMCFVLFLFFSTSVPDFILCRTLFCAGLYQSLFLRNRRPILQFREEERVRLVIGKLMDYVY